MRKFSFLTFLLVVSIISSQAQHFGVKIGASGSSVGQKGTVLRSTGLGQAPVEGKYWNELTPLIGANIGFFFKIDIKKTSIQPELLFAMRGFTNKKLKYGLNYIALPIMVNYQVDPKFSLQIGPEVSYLPKTRNPHPVFVNDDFKKIDYGLNIGGTYHLNEKTGINLRYYYGLPNTYPLPYLPEPSTTNRSLQVSLQYSFK